MNEISSQDAYVRDGLIWGTVLWLFGYALGFLLFPFVPTDLIGWYIMPVGLAATAIVLWRFVKVANFQYAFTIGLIWCVLAIILDFVFLVMLLNTGDGYYRPDVYVYYASAFLMPIAAALLRGFRRTSV
jgi:hypothetical protein